jgi:hypothetical protein
MGVRRPKRILFDWGGTICNDSLLFQYINNLGFNKDYIFKPDSWDNIKNVGCDDFFLKNSNNFFNISSFYNGAEYALDIFHGTEGNSSEYENYIVFDGKPELDFPQDKIQLLLAKNLQERGVRINGLYVNSDKLSLAKSINADFVIDDDPRIVLSLASYNIKSILISRLWNRQFSIDNINYFIPSRKKLTVMKNIFLAEDFDDVERIIKKTN